MGGNMNCLVRNATMKDWEAVIRIMNQVHNMHVEWRPDIYKPNSNIIPMDIFEKIVSEDTFFVAEADGIVVGIIEIQLLHGLILIHLQCRSDHRHPSL